VIGSDEFLDQIFKEFSLENIHIECAPSAQKIVERYYKITEAYDMVEMAISRDKYKSFKEVADKLGDEDLSQINQLLGPYAKNNLDKYQVTQGIYYGVKKDNKLVAVAGTHNISEKYEIGTIGNVATDTAYRRQNLAYSCCSRVMQDAFKVCDTLIVKVDKRKPSAISLYEKLGFKKYCEFFEGFAVRK